MRILSDSHDATKVLRGIITLQEHWYIYYSVMKYFHDKIHNLYCQISWSENEYRVILPLI